MVKAASKARVRRTSKWLMKLIRSSRNKANFHRHIDALIRKGYIAKDDYSSGQVSFLSILLPPWKEHSTSDTNVLESFLVYRATRLFVVSPILHINCALNLLAD